MKQNIQLSELNPLFLSHNDVDHLCRPLFDTLNLSHFHYSKFYDDGACLTFSNNPSWQSYYFQNFLDDEQYQSNTELSTEYVFLSTAYPAMASSAKKFKINNMLSLVERKNDHFNVFGFGFSEDSESQINIYMNNLLKLKAFAETFKRSSLVTSYHDKYFNWKTNCQCKAYHKKENQIIMRYKDQQYSITKMEFNCLINLFYGKSMKEISSELNLSPRTVEGYILNIKNKMKVNRKSELIKIFYNNFKSIDIDLLYQML
ncbi:MAG: helix-turn-helix transcriptional regulator [Gammaproteobacteria bacterium]